MPEPLLDDLAQSAPPPPPGFADAVIAAGRRRARRVRVTVAAASVVVVVALAVPLAGQWGRGDVASSGAGGSNAGSSLVGPSTTAARGSTPGTDRTSSSGPAGTGAPPEWGVYAAIIGHIDAAAGPSVQAIDVRDAVCANADRPTYTCTGGEPISSPMEQYILARLDSPRPIRFHELPTQVPPGSSVPGAERLFVTLGPARVDGARATVFVQTWCGFDCLRGDGYVLGLRAGRWRVTGSYGGYVS